MGYLENFGNPKTLYYFHMNGCGHCKTLMPEWDAASKENNTGINMRSVEMNEDDGPELCKKHNINKSEATNLEALERAQKSYKDALQKESAFKDLSPKEKELKLNIAIVKAFDALEKKNTIGV